MPARSFRPRFVAVLGTLAIAACASGPAPLSQAYAPVARVPSLTPTSRVIDAEHIRRSGAQTAWDAVRLLVPSHRLQANRRAALRLFGPAGSPLDESIRLVVDGHRVADLGALQAIPAREVVAIHLLSEIEAATYFGSGDLGGAIVVQTSVSFRRL